MRVFIVWRKAQRKPLALQCICHLLNRAAHTLFWLYNWHAAGTLQRNGPNASVPNYATFSSGIFVVYTGNDISSAQVSDGEVVPLSPYRLIVGHTDDSHTVIIPPPSPSTTVTSASSSTTIDQPTGVPVPPSPPPPPAVPPPPVVVPPTSSPSSPLPLSPDGSCGITQAGTFSCGPNSCCSQYNYCGTLDAYCGQGCQSLYGACTSQGVPSPAPAPPAQGPVSTDGSCGPGSTNNQNFVCPPGACCSSFSYCGFSDAHCTVGCQPKFGICH